MRICTCNKESFTTVVSSHKPGPHTAMYHTFDGHCYGSTMPEICMGWPAMEFPYHVGNLAPEFGISQLFIVPFLFNWHSIKWL